MEQPLVTIGIPVYNVGRFIGLTLKSVLRQTYTNFELIITDDGSTDNTVEVIRSFNDSRITFIVDGENHGISYRLNQQIDLAKGKYFVRMDGDDLMFPDRVEKEVAYLELHPDLDVVGGKAVVIGDENEIIGTRGTGRHDIKKSEIFGATRYIHPTVAGKIEWFRKWKYREEVAGCEDMDLWLRSYDSTTFADLDYPILFYRDPLKFKLKTYLNRQKKIVRSVWLLRKEAPSYMTITRSYIHSLAATLFSITLCALGKDMQMIARRNQPLNQEECEKYQQILNEVLSN